MLLFPYKDSALNVVNICCVDVLILNGIKIKASKDESDFENHPPPPTPPPPAVLFSSTYSKVIRYLANI